MAEIEKGLPNEPELKVEDVPVETVVEEINEEPKEIEVTETADGKQVVNEITLPYLLLGRQAYDYFNPYDSNRLR